MGWDLAIIGVRLVRRSKARRQVTLFASLFFYSASLALRSIWPVGKSPPETLVRALQELPDLLRGDPKRYQVAAQEAKALAAAFGGSEDAKPPWNGAPVRPIRPAT